MKLSHFAQALTLALIAVTAYLAWQAQEESSKANAKMDQFTQQHRALAAAQADASASLVPGLTTPLAMPSSATAPSSLPPLPTVQAAPAPVPAPVAPPAPISLPAPQTALAPAPAAVPQLPGPLPEVAAKPASVPAGSPVASTTPAPSTVEAVLTPLQRRVKSSPLIGKVKEALMEQGFVAVDVGTKHALRKGMKLDLRRDSAIVGRITVTDVEENEAIADLDLKSIPSGVKVQAGDELISVVLDR